MQEDIVNGQDIDLEVEDTYSQIFKKRSMQNVESSRINAHYYYYKL